MRNVRIEEAERVRSGSLAVVGTRREADVRRETVTCPQL
jgi:hypothetical protein